MQEAFVKAYASLDRFRPGAPFRPWLLKIVANETRNLHRASGRRAAREQRSWALAERLLLARPDDPAEATLSRERQEALVRGLARLSPPHRQVVTCRYLLDLDEAESAAVLGWPRGTVKSRLHRALARLRDVLDADADECRRGRRRTMAEHGYDDLPRVIWRAGSRRRRAASRSGPCATAVLERLRDAPAGRGGRGQPRAATPLVALAVGAVLLALLATPPVRAAVADWFGFGGVRVERGDSPAPTADPTPPTVSTRRFPAEAAAMVGFTVSVPEALGAPDGVEVSADRRIVSMSWTTDEEGVLRLDQFDAMLDFSVLKTAPDVFYAAVNDTDALWFEEPHEVALLEPDGTKVTHSARLAGHTLIWQEGGVTLRLEGDVEPQQGRGDRRVRGAGRLTGTGAARGGVTPANPSSRR